MKNRTRNGQLESRLPGGPAKYALAALFAWLGGAPAHGLAAQQEDPFIHRSAVIVPGAAPDGNTFAAAANGTSPANPSGPGVPVADFERNLAVDSLLRETIVAPVQFDSAPFSDVMAFLRERYGISVELDQTAIDDSLQEDTVVTGQWNGVSLEFALQRMLQKYNAGITVRQGTVVFISLDCENDAGFLETRIFDCQDLVQCLPASLPDQVETPAPAADAVASGGGHKQTPKAVFGTLERLVIEFVDPDSWSHTGSGDGVIRLVDGRLLVTNSRRTLNKTRDFLAYLHSVYVR